MAAKAADMSQTTVVEKAPVGRCSGLTGAGVFPVVSVGVPVVVSAGSPLCRRASDPFVEDVLLGLLASPVTAAVMPEVLVLEVVVDAEVAAVPSLSLIDPVAPVGEPRV